MIEYKATVYKILAKASIDVEAESREELKEILDEMNENGELEYQTVEDGAILHTWETDPDDIRQALFDIGCE